jgi:hypothetical protein
MDTQTLARNITAEISPVGSESRDGRLADTVDGASRVVRC